MFVCTYLFYVHRYLRQFYCGPISKNLFFVYKGIPAILTSNSQGDHPRTHFIKIGVVLSLITIKQKVMSKFVAIASKSVVFNQFQNKGRFYVRLYLFSCMFTDIFVNCDSGPISKKSFSCLKGYTRWSINFINISSVLF